MSIEVKVAGLALDEKTRSPIVVLKDSSGKRVLPIVIGIMEASAIAAQLEGISFPRPMTHDLLASVVREMGGVLESIEVTDLKNDTFYALLHIRCGDKLVSVDARPSDSIALALRMEATITVSETVFEKTSQAALKEAKGEGQEDFWKSILESMDDEDFGKYKM